MRIVVSVLAVWVVLVAPSAAQDAALGTFASTSAVWDGMLHVPVRCGLATGACSGDLTVRVPGETAALAETSYRVAAMSMRSVLVDPAAAASRRLARLASVDARLSSGGPGAPVQATLRVVHRMATTPTRSREVHLVHDRRGDGVRRLDLRAVTARVVRGRLILRFTCWRAFGPADMDHDVANFHADVTLHSADQPRHWFVGFFFWHGQPFAQAGASLFPNRRVRYSRPDGHSIRLSVPVRAFGHPRHLWIYPSVRGYRHDEDDAPRLNVRV